MSINNILESDDTALSSGVVLVSAFWAPEQTEPIHIRPEPVLCSLITNPCIVRMLAISSWSSGFTCSFATIPDSPIDLTPNYYDIEQTHSK